LLYSREWNRVKVALLAQADVYLGKGKTRVFRTFPDREASRARTGDLLGAMLG